MACKRKAPASRKLTDFFSRPGTSSSPGTEDESGAEDPVSIAKRAKHRTTFNPEWNDEFAWLLYKPEEGMFCKLCQKYNRSSKRMVFITSPCVLFRKDKLHEHQKTQGHADSVIAESHAAAAKCSGGVRAAVDKQVSLKHQAVTGAMKCVYWLAKEETAHHTKFKSLINLGKSLGCSYLSELEIANNATYSSHRIIDEFLDSLSTSVENDILDQIRDSPVVGLLCDESTDTSNLKQLVIFIRIMVKGQAQTHFLKIADICDGKAETIEEKLLSVCSQSQISLNKVFGFGSDGAAVMTGCRSGVAVRLRGHNCEMISIHCGAHRLALASSQAAHAITYLKRFDDHLNTIFYHFANSSVREAALHKVQSMLEEPVLCLKKAAFTRWLSHDLAVTTIRKTLHSLLATLEREVAENDNAVARGLLHAMKSYDFIASVYLLSDVLPKLTALSLVFQREDVDLTIIQPQVNATVSSLKLLLNHPGPYMQGLDATLTQLSGSFNFTTTENQRVSFKTNIHDKYLQNLISNLEDRFSDSGVLSALATIFNSQKAMCCPSDQFSSYGEREIATISAHFTTTVANEILLQEWSCFKHLLIAEFKEVSTRDVMSTLSANTTFSSLYPTLSKLASIALVVPVSTADCERGFSTMNRIKTDPRNRLKTDTLDKLIRLSSEGPELDQFNFERAATLWASRSNRRINI